MEDECFKNTGATTCIGKHNPVLVSILSKLIQKPIFLCNHSPCDSVSTFIDVLEISVTQSKTSRKMNFLQVGTPLKSRFACILETLNQCCSHCVRFEADDDNANDSSTQFLQLQKNQLLELHELFEKYCKTLPVFGLTSAMYDINLIRSYLLPIVVNKRTNCYQISPSICLLEFWCCSPSGLLTKPRGVTNLDSILKT